MQKLRSSLSPTAMVMSLMADRFGLKISKTGSNVSVIVFLPDQLGSSVLGNTVIELSDPIITSRFSALVAAVADLIAEGSVNA